MYSRSDTSINLSIKYLFVACCRALCVFDTRCWRVDSTSKSTFIHIALEDDLVDLVSLVCFVIQPEMKWKAHALQQPYSQS